MGKELLFSAEEIAGRVDELSNQISRDYEGREPVMIGVLNGAVFFFADLVRGIKVPLKVDFIRASSYGSQTTSSGRIRLTKDVEISLTGKPVILVEDIVDTGLTLNRITDRLIQDSPESLRVCALIDKTERREKEVKIDYYGFRVQKGFLVGYGLDFNEDYRHLPDIYAYEC